MWLINLLMKIKSKKVYLSQQVYNALVAGSLVIAKDQDQYAYLPKALGEKIDQKNARLHFD